MSNGLYERRAPRVPGLENLDYEVGNSIKIKDGKGSISTVAPAARYSFGSAENLTATAAVTTAGTVARLSGVPLDASSASNSYAVGFMMQEDFTATTLDFTLFGRIEETTNAFTAWGATAAKLAGAIVVPTTSADIGGVYYVCTTAGTTDGTEPAAWPTTVGATVTDGTVVWTAFIPSIAMDVTILSSGDSDDWQAEAGTTVTTDDFSIACPTDPTTNGYPLNKFEFSMDMSSFSITAGDLVLISIERVAIASAVGTDAEIPTDITVDKFIVDFS